VRTAGPPGSARVTGRPAGGRAAGPAGSGSGPTRAAMATKEAASASSTGGPPTRSSRPSQCRVGMAPTRVARARLSATITRRSGQRSSTRPSSGPVTTGGSPAQSRTRPTATPDPVRSSTNQTRAMVVSWSPVRDSSSPAASRRTAGPPAAAPVVRTRTGALLSLTI
jgi:hypothetical protein